MSNFISKAVLDQVVARLSDPTYGYNATYNSLAPGYGVPHDSAINFSHVTGKAFNFIRGNVSMDDLINTSAQKFPFVCAFVNRSSNRASGHRLKYHIFSGQVEAGVNVFLSFNRGGVIPDFTPQADCVEETMYTILNRARNAFPNDQNWSDSVVYNGDVDMRRTAVVRGAEFWAQVLSFTATFEANQRGEI